MTVQSIADEIFRELDGVDDTSIPVISFWLQSNIGKLNNLIDEEFVVTDGQVVPELAEDQKSLYKILYLISYFQRQVRKNLGAAAYTSVMEVKEGNRTVRRADKNAVAKNYAALVASYNEELNGQLMAYKMAHATLQQFVVPNPITTELGAQTIPYIRGTRFNNDNF